MRAEPPATISSNSAEAARLASLDSYAIVDTPSERAYDDIVRLARVVCDTPVAAMSLVARDRQWFKASVGLGHRETPRSESICALAIRTPHDLFEVSDVLADPDIPMRPVDEFGQPLRFYAGMPIVAADGHALGTVCVLDHLPRTLTDEQRESLRALARQTQYLLELRRYSMQQQRLLEERDAVARKLENDRDDLQRRHDDLKHVANHDPLTGLLNRAALEQLRQRPDAMQRLESGNYTLAVVDIDHFKLVNDRFGHLLGDRALSAVADVIRSCIRQRDLAVRYGGEEFLLVLPATPLAGAFEVAERIRAQMSTLALPFPITVSIGIAAGDPLADTPEQVFDRADQALYRAKAGGRDRVIADSTLRV
ncbi:MAG: sensor domain-containing diguanylate cyclase [Luteimonas sp.]